MSTKSLCQRASAVISGWNDVASNFPCLTATTTSFKPSSAVPTSFCFFASGSAYFASTSTSGPHDVMAGARMNTARNGASSSPFDVVAVHGIMHSNESICDPKKFLFTPTSKPPRSSCPPSLPPRSRRSAKKINPAHVPHTHLPLAWNARNGSNSPNLRAMFAIVVDSPPGMIKPRTSRR